MIDRVGFIGKSKSLWGHNVFDYGSIEKNGYNRFDIELVCKKHSYKFKQETREHLRGGVGCHYCYSEKYGRKPDGYWSYERCYQTAKKYEWLSDFRIYDKLCWKASVRKGYIKDFHWLKRTFDKFDEIAKGNRHLIYKYWFPQFNAVYIGLTLNLKQRHNSGHKNRGTVFNFCQENNIEIPTPQILENGLTIEESITKEQQWIEHYKSLGYTLLNKCKGGCIGSFASIASREEQDRFIEKCKKRHNNFYDYSKVKYKGISKKIEVLCPKHGSFKILAERHLKGVSCPRCSGRVITTEDIIEKFLQVHKGRYGYSEAVYSKMRERVRIMCYTHGIFEQTPEIHLKGSGCPECVGKKKNLTLNSFKEIANFVHENKYDYSKTKISGCRKYSNSKKRTKDEYLSEVNVTHKGKYDYSKVVYNGLQNGIIIICPEHGEFIQNAKVHLQGHGCPKCGIQNRNSERRLTTSEFIKRSEDYWGENRFDYTETCYINARTKVKIRCKKHNVTFLQKPNEHYLGHNPCKECHK